ncbi:uncharacterized protein LOC110027557 [Phalaenopsis equestris]|uniref:uncharacterized protein LOC110027557 n=1 Tax=Phalaenopsis equestris TaxID=78828 RepID=UPI0009E5ED2C|nr:uncharacterized protein LOC110027557 [Phalaenopsis equestris]XP_020584706.1 uncharacterized protein LOC110027557 [Phalaenopsis equestris]
MKVGGVYLLAVLMLHMLFFGNASAEGDSSGLSTSNTSSHAVVLSGTKNVPDLAKVDGEKKEKDQGGSSQKETPTNSVKDKEKNLSEEKDKPLEDPKASGEVIKETFDDGSNKDKPRTVDSQAAGCDPSNRCVDKKTKLVACLRVPGTDTQALSLVIQNKGKGSLDVKIIAPSVVSLEQTNMQIKAKEDKEVKVYVKEDNTKDSLLILQAGGDNCSLDFRNIIPNPITKSETLTTSRFLNTSTGFALLCIVLAAAAAVLIVWLCVRFRHFLPQQSGHPKYQKLEVGLPVSIGGKKEASDGDGGWDDSWGNGWDVEEAPMTPSKTISNPSLKGLASRRFNKDGWKD